MTTDSTLARRWNVSERTLEIWRREKTQRLEVMRRGAVLTEPVSTRHYAPLSVLCAGRGCTITEVCNATGYSRQGLQTMYSKRSSRQRVIDAVYGTANT